MKIQIDKKYKIIWRRIASRKAESNNITYMELACFQASGTVYIRSSLFWDVTQRNISEKRKSHIHSVISCWHEKNIIANSSI